MGHGCGEGEGHVDSAAQPRTHKNNDAGQLAFIFLVGHQQPLPKLYARLHAHRSPMHVHRVREGLLIKGMPFRRVTIHEERNGNMFARRAPALRP